MTTHNYRGYTFEVQGDTATIQTRIGLENMPIADALRFIDAAWNKFDRITRSNIVEEALRVAVNSWEYDGENEKAAAAAVLINDGQGATRSLEESPATEEGAVNSLKRKIEKVLWEIQYEAEEAKTFETPTQADYEKFLERDFESDSFYEGAVSAYRKVLELIGEGASADIINGSRADNPDFIAGACYAVEYVENELGIDLGETALAEFREENQE